MSDKNYQPNYKPSPYSEEEIKNLLWSLEYKQQAIDETKRVAVNMWNALANPETPENVKNHIKAYFHRQVRFDLTAQESALVTLYVIGCQKIAEIPFVPMREHIEALTGNDKEKAIIATEEIEDVQLFDSISAGDAEKLADNILLGIEDTPLALAALVYALGNETHPIRRIDIVDLVTHRCFFETLHNSGEYNAFIQKAVDYQAD